MLVSTVTAIRSGGGWFRRAAVLRPASAAACIIWSTARRVHVDHPGAGLHRGLDRLRHGVRDVVKLEVEEDARAGIGEPSHERRPLEREQAAADLEAAGDRPERGGELQRARAALDVERDQELSMPRVSHRTSAPIASVTLREPVALEPRGAVRGRSAIRRAGPLVDQRRIHLHQRRAGADALVRVVRAEDAADPDDRALPPDDVRNSCRHDAVRQPPAAERRSARPFRPPVPAVTRARLATASCSWRPRRAPRLRAPHRRMPAGSASGESGDNFTRTGIGVSACDRSGRGDDLLDERPQRLAASCSAAQALPCSAS